MDMDMTTVVWLTPEMSQQDRAVFVRVLTKAGITVTDDDKAYVDAAVHEINSGRDGRFMAEIGDVGRRLDGDADEAAGELVCELT